jgi:hypothetical protein
MKKSKRGKTKRSYDDTKESQDKGRERSKKREGRKLIS